MKMTTSYTIANSDVISSGELRAFGDVDLKDMTGTRTLSPLTVLKNSGSSSYQFIETSTKSKASLHIVPMLKVVK